jgi:hypothetical protein
VRIPCRICELIAAPQNRSIRGDERDAHLGEAWVRRVEHWQRARSAACADSFRQCLEMQRGADEIKESFGVLRKLLVEIFDEPFALLERALEFSPLAITIGLLLGFGLGDREIREFELSLANLDAALADLDREEVLSQALSSSGRLSAGRPSRLASFVRYPSSARAAASRALRAALIFAMNAASVSARFAISTRSTAAILCCRLGMLSSPKNLPNCGRLDDEEAIASALDGRCGSGSVSFWRPRSPSRKSGFSRPFSPDSARSRRIASTISTRPALDE